MCTTPSDCIPVLGMCLPSNLKWLTFKMYDVDLGHGLVGRVHSKVIAQGYERSRACVCGELNWEERVLVIRSSAFADRERHLLEGQVLKAQTALLALTPAAGP